MWSLESIVRSLVLLTLVVIGLPLTAPACSEPPASEAEVVAQKTQALDPVQFPLNTWVYNQVPGFTCGNGQAAGFGVNRGSGSDVFVYFAGGGGCYSSGTCCQYFNATTGTCCQDASGNTCGGAAHIDGYNQTIMNAEVAYLNPFNRADASNAFQNSTFIYIPYCTGDLHMGGMENTPQIWTDKGNKPFYYRGSANTQTVANWMGQNIASPSRVAVGGSSAGGYGALGNFWKFASIYYNTAPMFVVDDSFPLLPLSQWTNASFQPWSAWNMVYPAGCTNCATDMLAIDEYYASTYPNARVEIGALNFDPIIANYSLGFQPLNPPLGCDGNQINTYKSQTLAMQARLSQLPQTRFFVPGVSTSCHGMFNTCATPPWIMCPKTVNGGWSTVTELDPLTQGTTSVTKTFPQHVSDMLTLPASQWRQFSAQGSDLIVTNVGWNPAAPAAGKPVSFNATVKNIGAEATPAGTIHGVGFYVDGALVSFSSWSKGSIASGASMVLSTDLNLNWTATSGTHQLTAVVDDANRITEFNESNNQLTTTLDVSGATACSNPFIAVASTNGSAYAWQVNDARCATEGQAAFPTLQGTWKAMVSYSYRNVNSLVSGTCASTVPVVNRNNQQLFPSWNAIFTNQVYPQPAYPSIAITSLNGGTGSSGAWHWSGSSTTGTNWNQNCGDWTSGNFWWQGSYAALGGGQNKILYGGGGTSCAGYAPYLCVLVPN